VADNEWQPEDEKEEDEEYDNEDLREEELQTLLNTVGYFGLTSVNRRT
jgi:hypothetical protein